MNVGIAEQSMVGTAAGLALGGKVAVTCNAAPFLISRANEQIKVDVCYNNTNVKLFGLNAGASYGPLASTHHSIDDLAVMRGFGNIQIFAPSTPRECRQIIDYALAYQGPVYIRLDGKALPELLDESYRFVPGAVLTLREGEDVALVATGSTVHEVVEAAQQLADLGIQAKVVSVPSIRPCDTAALLAVLQPCGSVITSKSITSTAGWVAWWRKCWRKRAWALPCSGWGSRTGSTPPPPIAAGCVSTMGLMPPPSLPWCKKETDGLNARCVKRGRLLLQYAKCNDLLLRRYPVQEIALLRKHKR